MGLLNLWKDSKGNWVFGYVNLYAFDGFMLSANPGVNLSLTITALAERAMSKIPAVAAETSPVSGSMSADL